MSSSDVDLHVQYRIANAPMLEFPYPHIYVRDIFPQDFYARLRANLPSEAHLRTLRSMGRVADDYPDTRLVMPLRHEHTAKLEPAQRAFWEELMGWMRGPRFGELMIAKFALYLQHRFNDLRAQRFGDEALVVRDRTTYSLPPHTDAQDKVLSFLFYLPPDASMAPLGTSLYALSGLALGEQSASWGQKHQRPSVLHRGDSGIDDVGAQHHAGAAAERRIVHAAVAIGREVADVHRLERPDTGPQRAAGERMLQRTREHLGKQRQYGGVPAHGAAHLAR